MKTPFLELRNIRKCFCGIPVLVDINLSLYAGQTHGLLGCNGAGKSTLVRILAGLIKPESGSVFVEGRPEEFRSPIDSVNCGIAISPQELTLFEEMSISDNLFIRGSRNESSIPIHYAERNRKTREMLSRLRIDTEPDRKAGQLSQSEKYLLQFARCYLSSPKLLILDELSASLTTAELDIVHSMIDELKRFGTAVMYITHRMQDILSVSDQLTVLRDGAVAAKPNPRYVTGSELRAYIFGDSVTKLYPKLPISLGVELLKASHVSNSFLKDISLVLNRGEILGILGIAGSGRSRLLRALAGVDPIRSGSIRCAGREVKPGRLGQRSNIAYIPEERDVLALFPNFDCNRNITIRNLKKIAPHKVIHLESEAITCRNLIDRLGIRGISLHKSVGFLSGGNKQKVVVARHLHCKCSVYLFDEPTQGVDTAGKVEIYNIISELARNGAGIVFVSSDFAELLGMCDRILVMRKGRIYASCDTKALSSDGLVHTFME